MITGTIGRPAPHGPQQDTEMSTTPTPSNPPAAARPRHSQNRIKKLELMPEAMARSRMHERVLEAESQRRADSLRLAVRLERRSRRLQRRAERASQRARRALAVAVMQ